MEFSKDVVISIITSVFALVGALVSLVSALWATSQQRKAQIKLEETKAEIEQANERRQKHSIVIKEKIDFSARDLELIQETRDVIFKLLDGHFKRALVTEMTFLLSKTLTSSEDQYRKQLSIRDKKYLDCIHTAKITIHIVKNKLDEINTTSVYASDIDECDQAELRSAREKLRSIQNQIKLEYDKLLRQYIGA